MGVHSTAKMKQYRDKLKASGLRPVQLWVPDIRSRQILDAIRSQSMRVSSDPDEFREMDFVEEAMDQDGWE